MAVSLYSSLLYTLHCIVIPQMGEKEVSKRKISSMQNFYEFSDIMNRKSAQTLWVYI